MAVLASGIHLSILRQHERRSGTCEVWEWVVLDRELDTCLSQLASAMEVDVMAGASDPANHALPQQPLHPCLLPGAASFPTLHR